MSEATLLTPRGSIRVTREDLANFETPAHTATWRPVKHTDLVDALHEELERRGLTVRREQYAVQGQGTVLFGTLDLGWEDYESDECAPAIGLRTSNNKQHAISLAIGSRVTVCDNLVFAGDLIALRRRHTKYLDLTAELATGLDRYQTGMVALQDGIERLKATPVQTGEAKQLVYDIFRQKIVPLRLFSPVVESWHATTDNHPQAHHLWTLHNAFTSHVKTLSPAPAFRATVRLGKFFSLS